MSANREDQPATERETERQSGGSRRSQASRSKSSEQNAPLAQSGQGGQGGQTAMARRGSYAPMMLSASPFDLFRMSPFTLMRRFTEDLDRMFGDVSSGLQQGTAANFIPQVEMFERENQLVVRVDLPGMDRGDIRVEATDDGLLIEGERRSENEENRGGVYRSELTYGTFRRFIRLPEGVDAENAQAMFRNGVLEVTLQMPQQQSRRRQIEVKGEDMGQQGSTQEQAQSKAAGNRAGS
jgi:HSP20 family protein